MTEEATNAADPNKVKKQKDRVKALKELQDVDLKELLEIPAFRRYLWRHLNTSCGIIAKAEFVPNGSVENYRRGAQSVGAIIWAEIEQIEPRKIPQMMIEYLDYQESMQC